MGKTWSGHSANSADGKQGLQYGALTVPLIKAVQELDKQLTAEKTKTGALETKVIDLETRLAILEAK